VYVDPTSGTGTTSVTFNGVNAGQDTFSAAATIAGTPYTSNSAYVAWQATNGVVSLLSSLDIYGYQPANQGVIYWSGTSGVLYGSRIGVNSVIANQVWNNIPITGVYTDDGNVGEYTHVPIKLNDVKSDGTALTAVGSTLGWGPGTGHGNGSFVSFFVGSLVVSQAGTQTFYFLVDDTWAFYVGNSATKVQGTYSAGGSPAIPTTASTAVAGTSISGVGSWPIMGVRNTPGSNYTSNITNYCYVNFPSPGIYPFLAWWVNGIAYSNDNTDYFQMTYAAGSAAIPGSAGVGIAYGSVIKPVAAQAAPSPTTPAGNLQLALAQSATQIQGGSITINVTVQNIVYATQQYIPIFEGTTGKLFIYNDPSKVFIFQTYNGSTPDLTAAASNVFALAGNNTNWNGLVNIVYNDSGDGSFSLKYGGTAFPAGIAANTNLTVYAKDIAWYGSVAKSFDLYEPSTSLASNRVVLSGGGAVYTEYEVDWFTNPSSVSPSWTTVTADGGQHAITLTLSEPIPPNQFGANNTGNTVVFNATATGGVTVLNPAQAIDPTTGNLTGWTATLSVPSSTVNGSFNLNVTVTGTLTYLSGTVFVTGGVTYISSQTIPISTIGANYIAPVGVSCTLSTVTNPLPSSGETITGTAYTFDGNPLTMTFQYKEVSSGTVVSIGAGVLSNSYTGTVSGKTAYYKTYTFSPWAPPNDAIASPDNVIYVGFTTKDTVSTLSTQYFPTTTYNLVPLVVGGGGHGGCPAVEMWLDEWHQVGDVVDGMTLNALAGETPEYLTQAIAREPRQVQWHEFNEQPCYHFVAENGAEVIVSGSTPVPTREFIADENMKGYASDVHVGMHVITEVGGRVEWSRLVEAAPVGMRRVCRLYCGGRNFAAGVKPGKYIYTHNIQPNPK
jgi:hypothetical protein